MKVLWTYSKIYLNFVRALTEHKVSHSLPGVGEHNWENRYPLFSIFQCHTGVIFPKTSTASFTVHVYRRFFNPRNSKGSRASNAYNKNADISGMIH